MWICFCSLRYVVIVDSRYTYGQWLRNCCYFITWYILLLESTCMYDCMGTGMYRYLGEARGWHVFFTVYKRKIPNIELRPTLSYQFIIISVFSNIHRIRVTIYRNINTNESQITYLLVRRIYYRKLVKLFLWQSSATFQDFVDCACD